MKIKPKLIKLTVCNLKPPSILVLVISDCFTAQKRKKMIKQSQLVWGQHQQIDQTVSDDGKKRHTNTSHNELSLYLENLFSHLHWRNNHSTTRATAQKHFGEHMREPMANQANAHHGGGGGQGSNEAHRGGRGLQSREPTAAHICIPQCCGMLHLPTLLCPDMARSIRVRPWWARWTCWLTAEWLSLQQRRGRLWSSIVTWTRWM